jgi:hypothetical protein
MNLKGFLSTTLLLSSVIFTLSMFFPSSKTEANTLFPHTKELLITNHERTKEQLSFTNNSLKDMLVTPVIYSYDPQTIELTQDDGYIFTRADKEIFKVKPGDTLELEYEIVPISNMRPGTYFNLLVLEKQFEDTFITETNPLGATDSLAHLVVLHIADSEVGVYGITSEFAKTDIQILEKGIPFIRPTLIKYTYQNTTNYVLNPMGEIQVYSEQGKYPPVYIKINEQQKKLYPGGLLEEEFEIEQYHYSDLYSNRVIIGRFYNGIDENLLIKEIILEPNYIPLIAGGILIFATILLLKALFSKKDTKKSKKKKTSKKKKLKKNSV